MDFRTLTNEAIRESGITLDSISSGDFASPTDPMQVKMKNWVKQAWREIQMERNEWEYNSRDATLIISPRIYVELGDRATAPAAGYLYTTNETDVDLEIVATTTLSGAWASGTATAYLDVIEVSGNFKFNETVDETSPTIANTDVFNIRGWGRYDLATLISGFSKPQLETFQIQSTGSSTVQDNTSNPDIRDLQFTPWAEWNNQYETNGQTGMPMLFTRTPLGTFDFWPRLDKQYVLKCTHTIAPAELSAHDDEPDIPEQYQWGIIWRAVMLYSQYDRQPDVEMRAYKNYRFYKREMDRFLKPGFSWQRSRFDG